MKILITGVTGFKNRGVEALVTPTIRQLQALFPGCRTTIATWTPDYDKSRLGGFENIEVVEDPYLRNGGWGSFPQISPNQARLRKWRKKLRLGGAALPPLPPERYLPYEIPDLVVVSGGDLISSDYGTASLRHFLEPVHWAKAHGIPCALIGQSIGKFRNEDDIRLWKAAEQIASLITVREPLSRTYLVEELGSKPEIIIQAADTAFLLDPEPILLATLEQARRHPVVGLSISNLISKLRGQDPSRHMEAWESLIRHILDDWGADVRIIPHVQETYTDDRITSTEIWRRIGYNPRVEIIGADLSASEYKAALKNCDMVVAERMHAAIGAISTGIPTVPIGYSIKARGIITQVFDGTPVDPDSMVMDLEDFLRVEHAVPRLDQVWMNRVAISKTLHTRLPQIKELAMLNFHRIRQLLPA